MQKPKTPTIFANSAIDLYRKLKAIDISVPKDDDGRQTWQREQYCGNRFVATFAEEFCKFPISRHHEDKPDFYIVCNDMRNIGLEISEVRSKRDTSKCEDGFAGNGPEKYWSEQTFLAIHGKTEKFKDYSKHARNYLLLYCNAVMVEGKKAKEAGDHSQICLNMDIAIRFLMEKFDDLNYWTCETIPYDKIFIEHNGHFYEFGNSSQRRIKVNDLWS